jgi:hypothetical protein
MVAKVHGRELTFVVAGDPENEDLRVTLSEWPKSKQLMALES